MSADAPAGGRRGVIERATAWRAEGAAFALVFVARAEGSTFRKEGAVSAIASDGRRAGVLSGGCLESSVDELARQAIEAREPRSIALDTRRDDDLLLGSGSGCRGRLDLVALPSPGAWALDALDALTAAWTRGEAARVPLGAGFEPVRVEPPPRIVLLGAGPVAPPLLRLARVQGWWSAVADHREAWLAAAREAGADRALLARPAAAWAELGQQRLDAVIVMTHQAEADLQSLRAVAGHPVPLVGLLGPPARRDELIARLEPAEREALASRLHAPAGMRLGGDGPEAIALSIAAQLQSRMPHP